MKFSLTLIVASALAASGLLHAAESDSQVEARKVALDLAGAFSNDGFKLRDGHWSGPINKGDQAILAVNLYAGNQYWFSVGTDPHPKKFLLSIYDETGQPVTTETYEDEEKAAAGFTPTLSGQYFVTIAPSDGEASTFCLVYSYK